MTQGEDNSVPLARSKCFLKHQASLGEVRGESFSFAMAQDPRGLEQGMDSVFRGMKEAHYDRVEGGREDQQKVDWPLCPQGQGALGSAANSGTVTSLF